MSVASMQQIAWHHFICDIPDTWEAARYAIEARAGRIEWVERRTACGVVSWEPCAREPDRRTTMLAYLRARVVAERRGRAWSETGFHTTDNKPFLVGWHDDLPHVQALAWMPESGHLLRWIFETAHGPDAAKPWVRDVLTSFQPNDGPFRLYRLFGLHVRMPAAYEIERMAVFPANVMMAFEGPDKRRVTCRRWGLPQHLLGEESLEAFYRRILAADGARVQTASAAHVDAHEACLLTYHQRPVHQMERYFGRGWTNGEALIWYDRTESRLYACEQIGPERSKALAFADILPGAGSIE